MSVEGRAVARRFEPIAGDPHLTERELDVLHLAGTGITQKQIAYKLGISKRTIEIHFNRALDKIGVKGQINFAIWYAKTYPHKFDIVDPNLPADLRAAIHSLRRARDLIDSNAYELARAAVGGAEALLERHAAKQVPVP